MTLDAETQEQISYLCSLGATETVLKELARDADHDNLVVCPGIFSVLSETTADSVSIPVEFNGMTITFSLRKSLTDSTWWIKEDGLLNEEYINTVQRFLLNTYKHRTANWTYMIVSPYEYKDDLSDALKRQCIANCSLLIKY